MKVKAVLPAICIMMIAIALTACSDSADESDGSDGSRAPIAVATVTYMGPTSPMLSASSEGFASVAYEAVGKCSLVLNEQADSPVVSVTVYQDDSSAFASYTYEPATRTLVIQTYDDDGTAATYPFSVIVY